MVLNPDKCSFMLLSVDDELVCRNETLKNNKQEKVLGIIIVNKLNFVIHLLNITKNFHSKFNALTRVQKYMSTGQKTKKKLIPKTLTLIQLLYFDINVLYKTF